MAEIPEAEYVVSRDHRVALEVPAQSTFTLGTRQIVVGLREVIHSDGLVSSGE